MRYDRPSHRMYLHTPAGFLAWDARQQGAVEGARFSATLDGRRLDDASLVALLVFYAPDGF